MENLDDMQSDISKQLETCHSTYMFCQQIREELEWQQGKLKEQQRLIEKQRSYREARQHAFEQMLEDLQRVKQELEQRRRRDRSSFY
ncbi:MAG: hypothetical protein JOZ18_12465 [Chloroflexi bacterium]|nr:hypothetical protein [Chloroflexota bacterium]